MIAIGPLVSDYATQMVRCYSVVPHCDRNPCET